MNAFSENTLRERVVIIEDEIDLCLLMKQFFTRKNHEVYIACTLPE
jgi:DNA-binding response OmpR family regulator